MRYIRDNADHGAGMYRLSGCTARKAIDFIAAGGFVPEIASDNVSAAIRALTGIGLMATPGCCRPAALKPYDQALVVRVEPGADLSGNPDPRTVAGLCDFFILRRVS